MERGLSREGWLRGCEIGVTVPVREMIMEESEDTVDVKEAVLSCREIGNGLGIPSSARI